MRQLHISFFRALFFLFGLLFLLQLSVPEQSYATSTPPHDSLPDLASTSHLSLEKLDALLVSQNKELKDIHFRWRAAIESAVPAGSLPDPVVTFGWFVDEVETRVGSQEWKVGFTQKFPSKAKRSARHQLTLIKAEALLQSWYHRRNTLRNELQDLLREYEFIEESLTTASDSLTLLKNLKESAMAAYRSGKIQQTDIIDLTLAISQGQFKIDSLQRQRIPFTRKLEELCGEQFPTPIPFLQLPKLPNNLAGSNKLEGAVLSYNRQLLGLKNSEAESGQSFRVSELDDRPDLTMGLEYISTSNAAMAGVKDSGKDPVIAKFSWNIPLNKKKYRTARESARLKMAADKERRAQMERALKAELSTSCFLFTDAQKREELYRTSLIPGARQALEVSRTSFITGQVPFSDVIEDEKRYLEFQLSALRAKKEMALAYNRLQSLTDYQLPTPQGTNKTMR
jgi:outer membrane protein TolC